MWAGTGLLLRREDQQLCLCPPLPLRELLLGRSEPLIAAEHEAEVKRWAREYGQDSDEEFRRDQERTAELLRLYEYSKSTRRN
jgi:hypothetical protein